jgi:hypothetical protein
MSVPPRRRKTAYSSLKRIAKRLRIPFKIGDKTMGAVTSNEAGKTKKATTTTTVKKVSKKKSTKK